MNKEVADEFGTVKGASFPVMDPTGDGTLSRHPDVSAAVNSKDLERNDIFTRLVAGDSDIAGLVAYSIYKQNKLDWLAAFEAAKARLPNDAELTSYIIGEGTARRLATYRQLAEATLAGQSPQDGRSRRAATGGDRGVLTPGLIGLYALIAVLFVLGFWLAARFTMGH